MTPFAPCAETNGYGEPNALIFDRVLDHPKGPAHGRAVAAARAICATCPLATLAACLREYREEPGVIAGLTYEERVKPKASARRQSCGKPHGYRSHRRAGEAVCGDCRVANVERVAAWRAKRVAA